MQKRVETEERKYTAFQYLLKKHLFQTTKVACYCTFRFFICLIIIVLSSCILTAFNCTYLMQLSLTNSLASNFWVSLSSSFFSCSYPMATAIPAKARSRHHLLSFGELHTLIKSLTKSLINHLVSWLLYRPCLEPLFPAPQRKKAHGTPKRRNSEPTSFACDSSPRVLSTWKWKLLRDICGRNLPRFFPTLTVVNSDSLGPHARSSSGTCASSSSSQQIQPSAPSPSSPPPHDSRDRARAPQGRAFLLANVCVPSSLAHAPSSSRWPFFSSAPSCLPYR